jgi:hypothetical protein
MKNKIAGSTNDSPTIGRCSAPTRGPITVIASSGCFRFSQAAAINPAMLEPSTNTSVFAFDMSDVTMQLRAPDFAEQTDG